MSCNVDVGFCHNMIDFFVDVIFGFILRLLLTTRNTYQAIGAKNLRPKSSQRIDIHILLHPTSQLAQNIPRIAQYSGPVQIVHIDRDICVSFPQQNYQWQKS